MEKGIMPPLSVSQKIDALAALGRIQQAAERMGRACEGLRQVTEDLIHQNTLGKSRIDAQIDRIEQIVRDVRVTTIDQATTSSS